MKKLYDRQVERHLFLPGDQVLVLSVAYCDVSISGKVVRSLFSCEESVRSELHNSNAQS